MGSSLFYGDNLRTHSRFDYGSVVEFGSKASGIKCDSIPKGEVSNYLPRGHYWIATITPVETDSFDILATPRESSIRVVAYPAISKNGNWYRSTNKRYAFTCERDSVQSHFGARLPRVALQAGFIRQAVEVMLKEAGLIKVFDPEFDYDGFIKGRVNKALNKFKINEDDRDDMIIEVMLQVFDKKNLKKYNPKRETSFLNMISPQIYQRSVDQAKKYINREKYITRQREDSEMSEDEFMDRIDDELETVSVEESIDFKDMVEGLYDRLVKKGNKWLPEFFIDAFVDGLMQTQIAEKYGLSNKTVSKVFKNMRGVALEYSKDIGNDELYKLLSKKNRRLSSAIGDCDDDFDHMVDVVHTYARMARRSRPAGKVNKIKRISFMDEFYGDRVLGHTLDASMDEASRDNFYEDYISRVMAADDIIEVSPGRLMGLFNQSKDKDVDVDLEEGEINEYHEMEDEK